MIKFTVTKSESKMIGLIVARARTLAMKAGQKQFDAMSMHMDLSACIAQGTALKLEALLAADDFNFSHDVFGIQRHTDRDDNSPTCGQLLHCFVPRFADNSPKKKYHLTKAMKSSVEP